VRILIDYRAALRQRTGVGEFVHELTRALAVDPDLIARGDDLAILTTSYKDRPPPELAAQLPGIAIIDRRVPVRPLTWVWNRLGWPPVEWLTGAVDVVHAQTPLLIPAREAAQVITIHDLDFLRHPERTHGEMRRDFPTRVRAHARRADHIVVSSHYAANEVIAELGVLPNCVTICSPGTPGWSTAVASARDNGVSGSTILFLGTVEARKNVYGLLEAYALVRARRPDAPPLVIAGRLTPASQPLIQRATKPPLANCVEFRGYVPDTERAALYRQARMLVLPSFEEGFGLPVLEAMACGVPVVVSNRGSLPEVAGDAARPVAPDDVEALAGEMERLLDAKSACDAAARGLAQARRYTWAKCAASALHAYREAVTVHRTRRQ